MNPWEILEIAPTPDKKTIKRAYAKKLKLIIPDEQPEEFQRLKTAFDLALTFSKDDRLIEDTLFTSIDTPADSVELFDPIEDNHTRYPEQTGFPSFQRIDSFSDNLQRVIDDEYYFGHLSVWEKLTASINNWSIDEYMQNTYTIQLFLVENYPGLAKEIIRFLFQVFDLTELTDHIGQERFISTDFLYLKKTIYNVPPFSFQIADEIPKEQRKKYFHLRYDIYQTIVNKQGYIMNINAKISDCAEIFANDSELWNLQMINLLDKTNSLLDSDEAKEQFKSLVERTNSMNSNPTTVFLTSYFLLVNENLTDDTIFNWQKDQLTLPDELFMLLLGSIFFHTAQYGPAFNLWKQLELSRKIALQEKFQVILPYLSKDEKKEYRQIKREVRKVLKPETEATSQWIKQGFIFLLSGAFVLLLIFKIVSTSSTIDTPETTVDDIIKKQQTYQSIQQKVREKKENDAQLASGSLEEQFTHYFYASNDSKGKQLFINTYVQDDQLKQLLTYYVNQDTFNYTDFSAFSYETNTINDPNSHMTAVYYEQELLCILKLDGYQATLSAVYGDHWALLPDSQFQQLQQSILINPESSTTIFLKNFLFSDKKQQNLLEYTDYLSENMKTVLENKLDEPISENLRKGFLYLVKQPKIKFIVSDQNRENEEKLILTFDEQGRLDHVFGPNWEEVDEEMIHYSNREAFKNIPTLLEEPLR